MPTVQQKAMADAIEVVASKMEPKLRDAFLAAVEKVAGDVSINALAKALLDGDVAQVMTILGIADLGDQLAAVSEQLQEAYAAGGRTMAAFLSAGYLSKPIEIRFDVLNPDVIAWLRRYTLGLITSITEEQRAVTKKIMVEGLKAGTHPTTVARSLRDVIGLNDRLAAAVANFRVMLESNDAAVLTRALRDKRFDPSVKAALTGAKSLTQDQIDKMVAAYRRKALKYRAEMVARTEAMRALNEGQHQSMVQAFASGKVDGVIRRYWLVSRDERTCPTCAAVPAMNPKGVGLTEPFKTPNGMWMNPPAVHPGCRCTTFFRLVSENKWLNEINPPPAVVPNAVGQRFSTMAEAGGSF